MRSLVMPLLLLAGCDYSAEFLFTGQIEGVEDVLVIPNQDGERYHVPANITSHDDIAANAIFAEVSQSTAAALGGATLEFVGTGDSVCVWVDPELAFWSTAVAPSPTELGRQYSYPDNPFDDGDIDLAGGLSVFYTGSPGEAMGDFVVYYEDELGNEVPVELVECAPSNSAVVSSAYGGAGKAYPENCTFANTQPGVAYTVALTAWSIPLDDDRLSFGVLLANGPCSNLESITAGEFEQARQNANAAQLRECVILGEALKPEDAGPHYGRPNEQVWEGSMEFEKAFCRLEGYDRLDLWCESEASAKAEIDVKCDWQAAADADSRCYCGDLNDLPNPGAN